MYALSSKTLFDGGRKHFNAIRKFKKGRCKVEKRFKEILRIFFKSFYESQQTRIQFYSSLLNQTKEPFIKLLKIKEMFYRLLKTKKLLKAFEKNTKFFKIKQKLRYILSFSLQKQYSSFKNTI